MMLRLLPLIFLCIGMALLAACHPIQKIEYRYIPPQSSMDKKCASQCAKGRRYCRQICQLKHPDCFAKAYQDSVNNYASYQQECIRKGEKLIKTLQDFDQSYVCYEDCNCIPSFNTCYTACGGQVILMK